MTELSSGKGHNDENFPVASFLIAPRHRAPVMAFYNFVRAADDVADHESASADKKLSLLEDFRKTLVGESDAIPEGIALRNIQAERKLSPQHALDLLEAFRRDVTKLRYTDWDDLLDYCRYSAMPVGRYVLEVHGETQDAWPLNDALCAALQVINHLQDCGKDYKSLNRVYIPQEDMDAAGMRVEELGEGKSSPAVRKVIAALADKNERLLDVSKHFSGAIADARLGLEVSVIQTFAEDLNAMLSRRDPLSEKVHHGKGAMAVLGIAASVRFAGQRIFGMRKVAA